MTVSLSPNALVGSWRVLQRIGSGSYGTVYRAVHKDRPQAGHFALKVALKAGDERFEREAYLLSRIRHPSVPRFEDRGTWTSPEGEDFPYIVMEWVEGISMYAWALEHGLTLRQAISLLAQVARALQATHEHGVHRDVKGGNVRVSPEGKAVLLDFGSCWYPQASPLTGKAAPPGTHEYRSPALLFFEFALNKGAAEHYVSQAEDDVYALGVTAYRLLAGGYPPSDPAEVQAPRGLEDKCPELGELIVRLLSEVPWARGSAQQVAEELEALLEYSRPALDEPWVANASRQPTEEAAPPAPDRDAHREQPRVVPPASTEPSPRVAPVAPKEPPPHVVPSAPEAPAPHVASSAPLPRAAPAAPEETSSRAASAAAEDQASCLALVAVFIVLGGLLVVLTLSFGGSEVASREQGSRPYGTGSPDAGPAGLGEQGLSSVSPAETPQAFEEQQKVTRDMPSEPLPGQRLPPCPQRGAVVINGGCWRRPSIEAAAAPCDSDPDLDLYEYKGRCYAPLFINGRRVPTSKDPQ